jgi:hypothetical protein
MLVIGAPVGVMRKAPGGSRMDCVIKLVSEYQAPLVVGLGSIWHREEALRLAGLKDKEE